MRENDHMDIMDLARQFNVALSSHQVHLLDVYLDELCAWNKKKNLTGLSSKKAIINDLLIDSMIPSSFIPVQGRYMDVGSGSGFPGIPLGILMPELEIQFIESNSKKADFLRHVIRLLKLRHIQVVNERIEEKRIQHHPEGYHVITARALAPLKKVLKWCCPHLASDGLLVNFQGSSFADVMEEESDTIKKHGLLLHKTISYTLPGKEGERNILIFLKA